MKLVRLPRFGLLALLFAAQPLAAQMQDTDLTKRSALTPGEGAPIWNVPNLTEQMPTIQPDRITPDVRQPAPSGLNQQMLQLQRNQQFSTQNGVDFGTLQYPMLNFNVRQAGDQRANIPNIGTVREILLVSKYRNAARYQYPVLTDEAVRELVDQLSMQDINRFQFRRNRSDQPGIDTQRAGSGETESQKKNESLLPSVE